MYLYFVAIDECPTAPVITRAPALFVASIIMKN